MATPSVEMTLEKPRTKGLVSGEPSVKEILLQAVLSGKVGVDVVERLTALARQEVEYQAMVEFNDAMHRCQQQMKPIRAAAESDKGRYANYAQLDRVMRPIYTGEGISLSFSDGESPAAGWMSLICYVSRAGYTRQYRKDMPLVTTGAKGGQVMTAIHAQGSSDTYAKRILLSDIFNIAIDKDKDDDGTGNGTGLPLSEFAPMLENIEEAQTEEDLTRAFKGAFLAAEAINDWPSIEKFKAAKNARKAKLAA